VKTISTARLTNIILSCVLVLTLVFGWFFFRNQDPVELISSKLPQNALPSATYLFSIYGSNSRTLKGPNFVTVFQNEIYVSDSQNGVVRVFDYNGDYQREFGKGQLGVPKSIVFYNKEIYVVDINKNAVKVFDREGKWLRDWVKAARPTDLLIKDDTFYLLDAASHQILVCDSKGNIKKLIGKKGRKQGELYFPSSILIDDDNQIWVADSNNNRIQVFDSNGKLVKIYSQEDGGFLVPRGISFDAKGYLYVANAVGNYVTIHDAKGRKVNEIRTAENKNDKLAIPNKTFIDQNRRLYVAEISKNRVSVFAIK